MTTTAETNACRCTVFLTAGWCAAGSEQCATERRLEAMAYAINAQHQTDPVSPPASSSDTSNRHPVSAPDDDDWDYALRHVVG